MSDEVIDLDDGQPTQAVREIKPARTWLQPQQSITPAQLLQIAVERGDDLVKLEKLMDLQERWEQKEAKKAYTAALARFKAIVPEILKDKRVHYEGSGNKVTEYWHATLGGIVKTISPALNECGLAFQWFTSQGEGGRITVRCVLTHAQGYEASVELSGSPDTSGGKNAIQAVGSTTSYLQRYTLTSILGLSTMDDTFEDDGRASGLAQDEREEVQVELIHQDQLGILERMCVRAQVDPVVLLKRIKAGTDELAKCPAAKFETAVQQLNLKMQSMKAEAQ